MIKKGSSRKGMRRRQAIAAAGLRDEEFDHPPLPLYVPVKLNPVSIGIDKEIARIEVNPDAMPDDRLAEHGELAWGRQPSRRESLSLIHI